MTGNENVKIVFAHFFIKKWIDLRQIKNKIISGLFYTTHISSKHLLLHFVITSLCLLHASRHNITFVHSILCNVVESAASSPSAR